jgi:hypothetical protein
MAKKVEFHNTIYTPDELRTDMYGVSRACIEKVVHRETWRHI